MISSSRVMEEVREVGGVDGSRESEAESDASGEASLAKMKESHEPSGVCNGEFG